MRRQLWRFVVLATVKTQNKFFNFLHFFCYNALRATVLRVTWHMRRHLWHRQKRHHLYYKQICIISKAFTAYEGISKAVKILKRLFCFSVSSYPILYSFGKALPVALSFQVSCALPMHREDNGCTRQAPPPLPTASSRAEGHWGRSRKGAANRRLCAGKPSRPDSFSPSLSLSAFPIHGLFIHLLDLLIVLRTDYGQSVFIVVETSLLLRW